jgi:hypothetical protein
MENPMNMDDTRKPKKLIPQHKKLRAPDATLILALVPPGKIVGLLIASSDILKTLLDGPEGAMMLPDRLRCLLSNGVPVLILSINFSVIPLVVSHISYSIC